MNPGLIFLLFLGIILVADKAGAKDLIVTESNYFTKWDKIIRKFTKIHDVPWRWVKAVMWNESTFGLNPSVQWGLLNPLDMEKSKSSDSKSWGLMQMTLGTARELRPGTTVADLNNPEISIELGVKYLAKLIKRFGISDRESVIRGYNGGPGFRNTVAGQRDTPVYYSRFLDHLAKIKERQPGPEFET